MPKIFKEVIPYYAKKVQLYSVPLKAYTAKNQNKEVPVIVSLTTIPQRLDRVHLTIRSILIGNKRPKKMYLWLHERLKDSIPNELGKLQGDIFEIKYSPYTFSHRKLIHTLQENPSATIVTVDDDMMYPKDFLEKLYNGHLNFPNDVVTHYARQMKFDANGKPITYSDWPYTDIQPKDAKFLMPVGVFGALYPPNALDNRVLDIELMLKLTPKTDDLWFKMMSLLNGTTTRVLGPYKNKLVEILASQKVALKHHNIGEDKNRKQWGLLMTYFDITP